MTFTIATGYSGPFGLVTAQFVLAFGVLACAAVIPRFFARHWPFSTVVAIFAASAAPLIACAVYLAAFRWSFDAATTSRWFLIGIGAYLGVIWQTTARKPAMSWQTILTAAAIVATTSTVVAFAVLSLAIPTPRWGEMARAFPAAWFILTSAIPSAVLIAGVIRLSEARAYRRLTRWATTSLLVAVLTASGIGLLLQSTQVEEPGSIGFGSLTLVTDSGATSAALYVNMASIGTAEDLDKFTSNPAFTIQVQGNPGEHARAALFGTGYFADNYPAKDEPSWLNCSPSDSTVIASIDGVIDNTGNYMFDNHYGPRSIWWSKFGDRAVVEPPDVIAYQPGITPCAANKTTDTAARVTVNTGVNQLRSDSQIIEVTPDPSAPANASTTSVPSQPQLSWEASTEAGHAGPAMLTPRFVIQTATTRADAARESFLAALALGLALTLLVDVVRTFPSRPDGDHTARTTSPEKVDTP